MLGNNQGGYEKNVPYGRFVHVGKTTDLQIFGCELYKNAFGCHLEALEEL